MPGTAFGAKRRGGEGKTVRGGVQFSTANHDTAPRQTAHDLSVSVCFYTARRAVKSREEPLRAAERRGVRAARLRSAGVPGVRTSVRRPDIAGAGAGRDGAVRKGGV